MAAFNFPNSPSTNDTHTENSVTWKWNGTVWKRQGVAGAQGAAGSATISNNADNRVITGGSGTNLNGESSLTFDGTDLSLTTTDAKIILKDGNNYIQFVNADKNFKFMNAWGAGEFTFHVNGGERLRITSAGLVGINETNPSYQLDVKGDSGISIVAGSNSTHGQLSIMGRNSSGQSSAISRLKSYPDGSSAQSHFAIETRNSSAAMVEALRITSTGHMDRPPLSFE